ncbi:SGNH/GDSL hydrolase family protein [Salegentibacter chungangensis]|uniref:SGNH/GDSL hydrolase family protein n=1 Tax=Salegentibacter chungangensis TaxID=1335724 RepID=A0ABW3NR23_9FLAO
MTNYKALIVLFLLVMAGCSSTSKISNAPEPSENKFSYLALGDSYTIGESVSVDQRWPVQLSNRLNERGIKVAPPKIIAKTGWTTGNLLDGINSELDVQRDFDLVSILIGVNNQYQGKSIDQYEEELRTIFNKAINHSKRGKEGVFALSIPDYGVTPFGKPNEEKIREEINAFNAVFREVAEDFEVDFYNITPISREAETNSGLVAEDGLHPSGLMYRYWVDLVVDEVAQKLPEN